MTVRFIICFLACLTVTQAKAAMQCQMPPVRPVVNVTWTVTPLVMDYSKTFRELRNQGTPVITVPGYGGENALTEGLTVSKISFGGGGSQISTQLNGDRSEMCFTYNRIDMHINVDPIIHIAHEVPRGTCHAKAVENHEMQHYQMISALTRQYRDVLYNALAEFINETGVRGPFLAQNQSMMVQERERRLQSIVKSVYQRMLQDNQRLQATIDNVTEYTRVANLCRETR